MILLQQVTNIHMLQVLSHFMWEVLRVSSVFKTFGFVLCVLLRGYSGTWAVVYIRAQFSQPFLCCLGSALCVHS